MNRQPKRPTSRGTKPPHNRPPVRPGMDRPPRRRPTPPPVHDDGFFASLKELFSKDNLRGSAKKLAAKAKSSAAGLAMHAFYSRDRVLCGVVCTVLMVLMALLQTTVFSTIKPFGAIPDLMISFVIALSVTEGERWGAVWGIICAVVIEALGVYDVTLLPLLYMPVGYVGGLLCRHQFTGSAAVRAVMSLSTIPLRAVFTAIYMVLSPIYATPGEIFFEVVLPEAAATILFAMPIHMLVFLCLKPFHKTRADMVAER